MSSITIGHQRSNISHRIDDKQHSSSVPANPPLASTITIENNFIDRDIRNLDNNGK